MSDAKRARVIYNPSAGMRSMRQELDTAIMAFATDGWSVDVVETGGIGDAVRLAREAVAEEMDVVIAAGGDGTVNEVVNGLVKSKTALGVLPVGTANVWAKEMGLPLGDLVTGAQRLTAADIRLVDVGQACPQTQGSQPRYFVLWSGVGLDALITQYVEPQREMKRRVGALLFWIIGIREAWSYRGKRVTLHLDGRRLRKRVILVIAANAQLYGGIARIAPNAKVDDGLLDLVIFKGTGFWATAWHLVRVLLGLHVRDPQVEIYPVSSVTLAGKDMPLHVDAEPIGFAPVEIKVCPRALRVLVPKTANQSLFVKPS